VHSVSDLVEESVDFRFRQGDPKFSQPAGARGRWARRSGEEEEGEGEGEEGGAAAAAPRTAERAERGSAEARALLSSLPEPQREFNARRRAEQARAGGGAAAGEGEGGEVEEEDLSDFRPRVLTRAAADASGGGAGFFDGASWAELGVGAELCAVLPALGAPRPSHIQAALWRFLAQPAAAARSPHCWVTDAAGSGKTLAYLLPLLAQLRAAEARGAPRAAPGCPHVLVLAPTSELAQQVHGVVRQLSQGGVRLRSALATGGHAQRTQVQALAQGCEVLVGTPGRLAALAEAGALQLTDLRALVLDEADVLAGPHGDFGQEVEPLAGGAPPGCRRLLVTATLPPDCRQHLQERLLRGARAEQVQGPGLHRPAQGCEEQLVDCSGGAEASPQAAFRRKAEALLRVLASRGAGGTPTLVFCNTMESCREVENALKRRDRRERRFSVLPLHAAVAPDQRALALQALRSPPPPGAPAPVVVATDRASRGLDCAGVGHVVLFDFPRDASEYVRRVGRTARGAGGRGRVTVLVLGRQVPLARELMARNARGEALISDSD